MNILGQSFENWVTQQINFRQASLKRGSGGNNEDLQYQQSKTPWLRLASSIDVDNDGGDLAKSLILQGGVIKEDGKKRFDVTSNLGSRAGGAYGWGGDRERGYVPMPGITNAAVKFINNGALSKTEVTIKCYSKKQFELIDKLYMRPGYTLLLEFGWSIYLDSSGKPQSYDKFKSPALRNFLNGTKNQFELVKLIKEERKKRVGNYDGVFGKVSNFKWNFNPDGSYDITIDLVGLGDVVETLKVNQSLNKEQEIEDQKGGGDKKVEFPLIDNATKDSLSQWLFSIYSTATGFWAWLVDFGQLNFSVEDAKIKDFALPSKDYKSKSTLTIKKGICQLNQSSYGMNSKAGNPQMFITFGYLIAWLQKNILLNSENVPNCAFDLNFEYLGLSSSSSTTSDLTLFNSPQGNLSANPNVCLIPFSKQIPFVKNDDKSILEYPTVGECNAYYNDQSEDTRTALYNEYNTAYRYDDLNGRLSQVLLNLNFIATCLDEEEENDDGAKSLIGFLNKVLSGVNTATGSINEFSVRLNDDQTLIQFINNAPQTFTIEPPSTGRTICTFNTFGKGSFIRSINLDGSIPSNFASMVTIGAQANGNQTAGNATAFSKYNEGLIDRVIPVKRSEGDSDKEGDSEKVKEDTQREKIIKTFKKITSNEGFWSGVVALFSRQDNSYQDIYADRQWSEELTQTFQSLNNQFIQLLMGYLQSPKEEGGLAKSAAPFFLPFNLSLEIDGISGIKLYETFKVDGKVLPPSYDKDKIKLIITGTDHNIDPTAWKTTLNTQSAPST